MPWVDGDSQASLCSLISKAKMEKEASGWQRSFPGSNHNLLLLGLSEQQTDAPVLRLGLTVCPAPGRGNSSTIAKINPWEKAIQSSEFRAVGKKIISCQNTSRALISAFIKYREEHPGKERLETFPLPSVCGPGCLSRDRTLGLQVKWWNTRLSSARLLQSLVKMHPKRL